MSKVELTDEQYGIAMHALRRIATGTEVRDDSHRRITREEMINLARNACDAWKLSYGRNDSLGVQAASASRIHGEAPPQSTFTKSEI